MLLKFGKGNYTLCENVSLPSHVKIDVIDHR